MLAGDERVRISNELPHRNIQAIRPTNQAPYVSSSEKKETAQDAKDQVLPINDLSEQEDMMFVRENRNPSFKKTVERYINKHTDLMEVLQKYQSILRGDTSDTVQHRSRVVRIFLSSTFLGKYTL